MLGNNKLLSLTNHSSYPVASSVDMDQPVYRDIAPCLFVPYPEDEIPADAITERSDREIWDSMRCQRVHCATIALQAYIIIKSSHHNSSSSNDSNGLIIIGSDYIPNDDLI